jgi:hypothetical protein
MNTLNSHYNGLIRGVRESFNVDVRYNQVKGYAWKYPREFVASTLYKRSRDSSVGIETIYELDG